MLVMIRGEATDMAVMIADRGEAIANLAVLHGRSDLSARWPRMTWHGC
jgi:hypothetical protein